MLAYVGHIIPKDNHKFYTLRQELLLAIGEHIPSKDSQPDITTPDYPIELDDPDYHGNVTPLQLPRR